jgi:hypothetical protein
MASKVLFLGFVVSAEGLQVDESKIEVIRKWPTPTTTTEARSFHGLASFYRRFIPHFSSVTAPITDCMKREHFTWTLEAEQAFQEIKRRLTTPPILALPDFTQPFELHADASKVGIGAVLSQQGKPIAYFSEKLSGAQARYSAYDAEFYAVVQAIKHWRHYLVHTEFVLYTDHEALKHLQSQDKVSARHASWIAYLQSFTFVVKHTSGVTNKVADALSRRRNVLTHMRVKVPWVSSFSELLQEDPFFASILDKINTGEKTEFILHEGFLFKGNCLCIPECSWRLKIIQELHGEGHVGRDRTTQLVQSSYF